MEYRLPSEDSTVSLLRACGCACLNLVFKAGGPPSYDAMARVLDRAGVRPALVVLEIDQKVIDRVDDAYARLHPALADLGAPLLPPGEHAALAPPAVEPQPQRTPNAVLGALWLPYAVRSDVRETLAGDADAGAPHTPTADDLEGTYDLAPLTPENVGVRFLADVADRLHAEHVPALAFFALTNHTLVGEYIDSLQHRARGVYLRALLERRGVRVLDLDTAVAVSECLDEVHLTVAGQRRLAALLAPGIRT